MLTSLPSEILEKQKKMSYRELIRWTNNLKRHSFSKIKQTWLPLLCVRDVLIISWVEENNRCLHTTPLLLLALLHYSFIRSGPLKGPRISPETDLTLTSSKLLGTHKGCSCCPFSKILSFAYFLVTVTKEDNSQIEISSNISWFIS